MTIKMVFAEAVMSQSLNGRLIASTVFINENIWEAVRFI